MSDHLVPVNTAADILPAWQGTPVATLLEYHNLGRVFEHYAKPELLIGMCMDYRLTLRIPRNFAFIIRTAAANLRAVEFHVSFALAVGGVRAIALIGHDDCAMTGVTDQRDAFVDGLVSLGCPRAEAEAHFDAYAEDCEITSPAAFVAREAERLRKRYPKVLVAPLHYSTHDGKLYQVHV